MENFEYEKGFVRTVTVDNKSYGEIEDIIKMYDTDEYKLIRDACLLYQAKNLICKISNLFINKELDSVLFIIDEERTYVINMNEIIKFHDTDLYFKS